MCVDVPISSPRQECRQVPRTVCDVLEGSVTEESCTVVPSTIAPSQGCKWTPHGDWIIWCKSVQEQEQKIIKRVVEIANQFIVPHIH